ncbi:MAG: hypothetical protein ABIE46_03245 [Patescibacteria group bacterium]
MTKLKEFQDFSVPKYKAEILEKSKENQEFYQEVARKTAEKFGKDSKAYQTIMNGIGVENITGSQFFWNSNLNAHLPIEKRVMTLEDAENIEFANPNFTRGIYTDTTGLCLRTKIPSWEKNKQILGYLIRQLKAEKINGAPIDFSSENPIILSNLELIKDSNLDNFYGIKLKIGDDTKIIYDKRFASGSGKIKLGNVEKNLYTRKDGLSRVFLAGDSDVSSYGGYLQYSYSDGRVVVVNAVGVAPEILETYYNKLKENREQFESKVKGKISNLNELNKDYFKQIESI